MIHTARWTALVLVLVLGLGPVAGAAAAEKPEGFDPQRHLPLDEIEPGMTGYGMTVFQGAEPEPFAVEVVSIQQGFDPGRAVIWVRCPDERMQQSGPVQGMSGSPIYLWTDEEEAAVSEPGEGGRIIGAFAYGYAFGKDCYVGVQPIEHMLETSTRASGDAPNTQRQAAGARRLALEGSHFLSRQAETPQEQRWRLEAISQLAGFEPNLSTPGLETELESLARNGQAAMPLMVSSSRNAELLSPFFTPLGLFPTPSPTRMVAGSTPPPWIQSDQVEIKPGSVLAVPLAFGPMELSAMGTATDVLDDGRVLGFGHSMFGQGDIAIPMATGHVHFIQPNMQISFKLGGSLDVKGAIVRDEAAGIVGTPDADYRTFPVNINFAWPGGDLDKSYEYDVVHHEQLISGLLATIAMDSLDADVALPQFNTVHVTGTVAFDNGATVEIDDLLPNSSVVGVALSVVPAVGALIESEFGSLGVERVDLDVAIEDEARLAQVADVTLERAVVRPGESVVAHVRLVPFRGESVTRQVEIDVPRNTPEGEYMLMVGGANAYFSHLSQRKPHLNVARSKDELVEAVQDILAVRDDALYGVLTLNPGRNNLAIGRNELPELPSSRRAMLMVESSTRASRYIEGIEQINEQPFVVSGGVMMSVEVREEGGRR